MIGGTGDPRSILTRSDAFDVSEDIRGAELRPLRSGRSMAELRTNGETIPDDLLARFAPLGWEHITFNGDSIWPAEPLGDGFRPLRDARSPFLEAA